MAACLAGCRAPRPACAAASRLAQARPSGAGQQVPLRPRGSQLAQARSATPSGNTRLRRSRRAPPPGSSNGLARNWLRPVVTPRTWSAPRWPKAGGPFRRVVAPGSRRKSAPALPSRHPRLIRRRPRPAQPPPVRSPLPDGPKPRRSCLAPPTCCRVLVPRGSSANLLQVAPASPSLTCSPRCLRRLQPPQHLAP